MQIAHEIIAENGGRITVMQTMMPDTGPGALKVREDPNERSANVRCRENPRLVHF